MPFANKKPWIFKLLALFVLMMITGLVPWETLLPIQIIGGPPKWLTSAPVGLAGLIGAISITWVMFKFDGGWLIALKILSTLVVVVAGLMLVVYFIMPTFEWTDSAVFKNGDDYLVVQNYNSFVTSSIVAPRAIRTRAPFAMVRWVEEQCNADDCVAFIGNEALFRGKKWDKVALDE